MVKKNVKVVYAYTSAVLLFLQFLQKRGYKLNLKAIFTTAELFIPSVRPLAKEYCQCDVIDTYGANDGGIQAFECRHHTGYHLNFERCMVEIIYGELVLTDLLNKAMPLDRKSTRLNSSHVSISYAVFCLKKKTTTSEI